LGRPNKLHIVHDAGPEKLLWLLGQLPAEEAKEGIL
jgi:hypothetical protein